MKPKLNIIPAVKNIKVNGKEITIPKLGFRHIKLLKDMQGVDSCMIELLDSIRPGLTAAEADMVILHLLAFNKKLPTVQTINGFDVDIDKAYISAKYEFELNGNILYFKPPMITDTFVSKLDILTKQYDKEKSGFDFNFEDAPAFVLDWADFIVSTISLDTPFGKINGGSNIIGII
ncbi:baseplate hub distal subunit [Aeromonas phage Aes012]|jgi:hypothetical protein|uniref:Gp28 base plate distal hub sub n=5 Tax=Tulanevirus TaxID=2560244 RepID=Q19CJ3_9CAUD|nr:baseplate hub distal subunit [Aeromonas phage phiAS4]YP_007677895.1 baseplate hub distal subunit [Aeromonas phage Aes012]YP_010095665.1 baseplate hub distal subunit [Aeromonas phage 50AhydR13PP]YP_010095958.1 baseplate hub distal subunit [Aeromonas phage 60AhydR15PP]YP_656408.1 baseplate hub distal subunit [Aeromonas phage 25]ABF72732.1 gp28 base plate distal hub sub [Aeromonas phage 25]ADM79656.1 baseplate distal hub sub [Aeromonas phage phiAS4]AFN69808.1 baseplate hub distal subunit [Ae